MPPGCLFKGIERNTILMHYYIIFALTLEGNTQAGTRVSLSISTPNEEWIQAQIGSGEFSSRSEVVNGQIRRAREIEAIRARLIAAEQSVAQRGWVTETPQQMLDGFKAESPSKWQVIRFLQMRKTT